MGSREMTTIDHFFEVGRGTPGLTEEFIYNNPGDVPVISAQSDRISVFGLVSKEAVKEELVDFPVVLVVRVGKAGVTRYFPDIREFVATENALYVYPKPEFRQDWNLKWLEAKLQTVFVKHARGDVTGQRNISAEIIKRIPFAKEDLSVQNDIADRLVMAENLIEELRQLLRQLEDLTECDVV